MAHSGWQNLVSNFRDLMNTDIIDVVHKSYREAKDRIDLTINRSGLPTSIFDRSYTIMFNGMQGTVEYVNDQQDFQYNVQLQLAFGLNNRDDKLSYTKAIEDLEEIIRKRLDVDTFTDTTIVNIIHTSTDRPAFIGKTVSESFLVITVNWLVSVRRTY